MRGSVGFLAGSVFAASLAAGVPVSLAGEPSSSVETLSNDKVAAIPGASVARAFKLKGYMGGFKIGEADAAMTLDGAAYRLEFDMKAGGMLAVFSDWKQSAWSEGAMTNSALELSRHRNDTEWDGKKRHLEMERDGGALKLISAEPDPRKDDDRVPVTDDLLVGVSDPLTAFVNLGRQIASTGDCAGEVPIYDGRRRYNVQVTFEGMDQIDSDKYPLQQGDTYKCSFTVDLLAGHKKVPSYEEPRKPPTGTVWFREVADGMPPVPVRFETMTKFGAVRVHMTESY